MTVNEKLEILQNAIEEAIAKSYDPGAESSDMVNILQSALKSVNKEEAKNE